MKRMSPWAYAHLIKAMEDGERSCAELAEATGLHILTVYHYTKALHQVGMCHIAERRTDNRGRALIRIYKLGRGKDAPRVVRTPSQRAKQYRGRLEQMRVQNAICGMSQTAH